MTDALSVVLSLNDLEALEIYRLVAEYNRPDVTCTVLKAPWGQVPELTDEVLHGLENQVLLVEIPSPEIRARIEATNRQVTVIDHHMYLRAAGTEENQPSPLSSLEQVAQRLAGPTPTPVRESWSRARTLAAIGDRAFIAGMEAFDMPQAKDKGAIEERRDLIRSLREQDLTLARLALDEPKRDLSAFDPEQAPWREDMDTTRKLMKDAHEVLNDALTRKKETDQKEAPFLRAVLVDSRVGGQKTRHKILFAILPEKYRLVAADVVTEWMLDQEYRAFGEPAEFLLLFYKDNQTETFTRLEWSGRGERWSQFVTWFAPEFRVAAPELTFFAGGAGVGAYCGAEDILGNGAQKLRDLANRILNDTVSGARPVHAWRTSFSQALFIGDPLPAKAEASAEAKKTCCSLKTRILGYLDNWRKNPQQIQTPDKSKESPPLPAAGRPGLWPDQEGVDRPTPLYIDDQEQHYFSPHVRDLFAWCPQVDNPAGTAPDEGQWQKTREEIERGYRLASVNLPCADLTLRLSHGPVTDEESRNKAKTYPLESLRLHFFYHDTVIVEWTLAQGWDRKGPNAADLVTRLTHPTTPPEATLAEVIQANAKLRYTHSNWVGDPSQDLPHHITLMENDCELATLVHAGEVSPTPIVHWYKALIQRATGLGDEDLAKRLGPDNVRADHLFDDRARVVSTVLCDGASPLSPPGQQAMDYLLAQLTTVDPYREGPTYDKNYTLEEYKSGRYDRYLSMGTTYAATAHSLVMQAYTDRFPVDVLGGHMATLYRRMFLIGEGYNAVLSSFSLQVTEALKATMTAERAAQRQKLNKWYDHLHVAQLQFTNHIWYQQISTQVQGVDLFDIIRKQQGLDKEYDLVRDEIAQMQAWLGAKKEQEHNEAILGEERMERNIALVAVPFGLFTALLATKEVKDSFFLWHLVSLPGKGWEWMGAAIGATIISLLLFAWLKPDALRTFKLTRGLVSLFPGFRGAQGLRRLRKTGEWGFGLLLAGLFLIGLYLSACPPAAESSSPATKTSAEHTPGGKRS